MSNYRVAPLILASFIGTVGGASLVALIHHLESNEIEAKEGEANVALNFQGRRSRMPVMKEMGVTERQAIERSRGNRGPANPSEATPKKAEGENEGSGEEELDKQMEEMTPEDSRQNVMEQKEAEIDEFEKEVRDDTWAAAAERDFTDDFVNAISSGNSDAELRSVECRASRCVVSVDWPSLKVARRQHSRLATGPKQRNCIVSSFLIPSSDGSDDPVSQDIVYNCRPSEV